MSTISLILFESWDVLVDSAPFMLFGFAVAGLLRGFLPDDFVSRHLGRGKGGSVLKASLFGVPLPLCSCGVIPAAAGLRKQGASKGATTSFLISTPETGVDSIAVTWALLDPVMTLFRPLAAFLTAMVAGFSVDLYDKEKEGPGPPLTPLNSLSSCSGSECGCSGTSSAPTTFMGRLRSGMRFAFGELLGDIGKWFLVGVLLAGMIGALLPADIIATYLGEGILPMLAVLVVAVPLYVCATASTPIVAALALKGLSPGAALVFLLAGPATNVATLTVVSKIVGKRSALIYLAAIVGCSLVLGMVGNWVYGALGLSVTDWVSRGGEEGVSLLGVVSALVLVGLIARALWKERRHDHGHTAHGH
ncbi:MAG TPA: SO_0444 family Cu/Zn efflux transporter [Desulfomicrobiaceae bacterium]|nr:SO_0444 family Cu/Zn efflux transporter [Desulfomicrobiaceae bacterium]